MDASDVYIGARCINLTGVVYGGTIADTFDKFRTSARPSPRPWPTLSTSPTTGSSRSRSACRRWQQVPLDGRRRHRSASRNPVLARPLGQPQFSIRRDTGGFTAGWPDRGGGDHVAGLAGVRGPTHVRSPGHVDSVHRQRAPGGTIVNRGDYPAPLDVLLGVTSNAAGGRVEIDWAAHISLALGALTNAVVRYSGTLKVLTLHCPVRAPTCCAWTC